LFGSLTSHGIEPRAAVVGYRRPQPPADFMAKQLLEYRMLFEKVQPGETANPGKLGLRSKLGGAPDWDQGDETPQCPHCQKEMSFIGQIDSIEHDEAHNPHRVDCLSDDQEYMMGDVGLIYVFFCFECLQPTAVFQCG
jgi:hypothetical protein